MFDREMNYLELTTSFYGFVFNLNLVSLEFELM